jgi:hypothetical protein
MIRVTIELISAINGQRSTLGVMDICNDGQSDDPNIGHYYGKLYRKGAVKPQELTAVTDQYVQRRGKVKNYPRKSYVIWRLIIRMLRDMFPEEK